MANFEDIAKKAFYLGVGFASYAQEKANDTVKELKELKVQAQKLAKEMVERGEMNTEEARKFVEDLVNQAQETVPSNDSPTERKPRRIEIVDEDESTTDKASHSSSSNSNSDSLKQQVQSLQEELRRLKKEM